MGFPSRPAKTGAAISDFGLRGCAMPEAAEGELLVQSHLFSLDPTMRNAMAGKDSVAMTRQGGKATPGYYDMMNWQPGAVPVWRVVSVVVGMGAKVQGFSVGERLMTTVPWRRFNTVHAKAVQVSERVPAMRYTLCLWDAPYRDWPARPVDTGHTTPSR